MLELGVKERVGQLWLQIDQMVQSVHEIGQVVDELEDLARLFDDLFV